jgi:hypothetical protein
MPNGPTPTRIGIVVGSIIDPATIANPHIRAHAQEGQLFRTVVETAAKKLGIASYNALPWTWDALSAVLGRPRRRLRSWRRGLP